MKGIFDMVKARSDALYRLIASLAGILTLAAWHRHLGRPTGALAALSNWAGFDLDDQVQSAAQWVADPSRAPVIATVAYVFMLLAALGVAMQPELEVLTYRCAPSLVIGAAVATQCGRPLQAVLVTLMVIVILTLACVCEARRGGAEALSALVMDLVFSLLYALMMPIAWAMSKTSPKVNPA